jgi:glycosyltransferase involved in cell wall biosynthesis
MLPRRLKILHVRPQLNPGGATEYLLRLAAGLIDRGHSVVVAADGGAWVRRLPAGCTYVGGLSLRPEIGSGLRVPNAPGLLYSVVRLVHLMRVERIDVIHTHHRSASLAARVASLVTNVPLVSSVHEIRRRYRRLTSLGFGERVVVLSDYVRAEVLDWYGLAPERVRLIPLGLDLPEMPSLAEVTATRRELGISERGPIVACIARLTRRKGQGQLLSAIPAVLAQHPDARFLFVGDGPDRLDLVRQARALGVAERVRFAGNRDDIAAVIAGSCVTVLPSRQEEFGIALLESLALSRPVVATRVGGVPEIVEDGRTGILVRPGDPVALAGAINRLLDHPAIATRLGRNGRHLVAKRFSKERFLGSTEALYRELVRQRGSGG